MKTSLKIFAQKCIAVCAVLMLTMAPFAAHAQFQLFPDEPMRVGDTGVDYRNYVKAFYNFSIGAGILIATVLIMVGGIMWVTSAGNPSRIDKAKDYITDSIIGVVLLIAAYTILQVINPNLVNLTLPEFPKFGSSGSCKYAPQKEGGKEKCVFATKSQCDEIGKTAEGGAFAFTENDDCSQVCPTRDNLGFCTSFTDALRKATAGNTALREAGDPNAKSATQIACEAQSNFGAGHVIQLSTFGRLASFVTDSAGIKCKAYCSLVNYCDAATWQDLGGGQVKCFCVYNPNSLLK